MVGVEGHELGDLVLHFLLVPMEPFDFSSHDEDLFAHFLLQLVNMNWIESSRLDGV